MEPQAISEAEALAIVERPESYLWDHKSAESSGSVIQKIAVAFANADGGEFTIGIRDKKEATGLDRWVGFQDIEEANHFHQALVQDCEPAIPYTYVYLQAEGRESQGVVCLVQVTKSPDVHWTAAKKCYLRSNAASQELTGRRITDLQLSKGSKSFEDQLLSEYDVAELVAEPEFSHFLSQYTPTSSADDFVRRERLADRSTGQARVAAAILFAEHPPGIVPKRCAIKIARYNTKGEAHRDHLSGTPLTIEGPARTLIDEALETATKVINSVTVLEADGTLQPMEYPPEALKEIVVNAVIHRDYNISDDIQVSIFDNRVEVRSPGGLPGQMTLAVLFRERATRNNKVLRLLNKYENPHNQDFGEGLTTVVNKMAEARLRPPKFAVEGNYFIATLPHERLARPEEIVLEYLASHPEITNFIGRGLTGIQSENTMKEVFYALRKAKKIERVPGKQGNKAAWKLV